MLKFLRSIINHYYTIFVLLGVFSFFDLPDIASLFILLVILCVLLSLQAKPMEWGWQDVLIVIFILYQVVSCAFSNYPIAIWYYGIKGQVMPILFYFLGRNMMFADNKMLENMKNPMMFAMTVGLILYFWAPSWYIARRTAQLMADASENSYFEHTRLSSFWPWSYTMGYGSLYFIMYYFKDFFADKIKKQTFICLLVAALVLFFAQQRASLGFGVLFFLFITVFGRYQNRKRLVYIWCFIGICVLGITYYLLNYADAAFLEYVLNRSVDSDENLVNQRFQMFSSFWKVTLLGDGVGRYGHSVLHYNMKSITDCEYIRLMCELGIVGCTILGIIFIRALWKAARHIKYYMFEFCILAFFLVAMIGATPLENTSMQPFLLWYCIGRIFNSRLLKFPPPINTVDR